MVDLNHRTMRAPLIAAAQALFYCALATAPHAKPITMEYQDLKITYTAQNQGTKANSIDLVLVGTGGKLNKFKATVAADGFAVTSDTSSYTLTPKNPIADGATVTIRIKSFGAYNGKIGLQSAVFSNNGTPVGTGAATGGALMGDPTYTISDDVIGSPELMVEDLTFYESHAPVDFATLDPSVQIDMTGIAEPDLVLDGVGTSDPFTVPPIAANDYFIAQGEVVDEDTGQPVAWFVDGYTTSPVPEPPIAALLILPLLGLVWVDRRNRRVSGA
jgi:hypothetical protein